MLFLENGLALGQGSDALEGLLVSDVPLRLNHVHRCLRDALTQTIQRANIQQLEGLDLEGGREALEDLGVVLDFVLLLLDLQEDLVQQHLVILQRLFQVLKVVADHTGLD